MPNINKELLNARLSYLSEIKNKPGSTPSSQRVLEKLKELIDEGKISNYMTLESAYSYLDEKLKEDESQADKYAEEIISFIA